MLYEVITALIGQVVVLSQILDRASGTVMIIYFLITLGNLLAGSAEFSPMRFCAFRFGDVESYNFV